MECKNEILCYIQNLRSDIERQKNKIILCERMSKSLGSQDFSRDKIDGTKKQEAPFERWIYKGIEAKETLKKLNDELSAKLSELGELISKLEDSRYQEVLQLKYIENLSWDEIINKMMYSRRSIFRFHNEAKAEIEKLALVGTTWHSLALDVT